MLIDTKLFIFINKKKLFAKSVQVVNNKYIKIQLDNFFYIILYMEIEHIQIIRKFFTQYIFYFFYSILCFRIVNTFERLSYQYLKHSVSSNNMLDDCQFLFEFKFLFQILLQMCIV